MALTPAGAAAFGEYQTARVRTVAGLLAKLPEDDLDNLHRLTERLHDLLAGRQPMAARSSVLP